MAMGFKNVRCLAGGVEAWKKAGYPLIESLSKFSNDFMEKREQPGQQSRKKLFE